MRILLVGYYGKANFGDDVLFKVTYNYISQWKPDADIFVLCDNYKDDYLPKLVNTKINIVEPGHRDHYDLIVHGGGGTFFDFSRYSIIDRFINHIIKVIGYKKFVTVDRLLRNLLNKKRVSADQRIGLGIGVGTYNSGSKKLRDNISVLLDFDTLIVRDVKSISNLKKLSIDSQVILGSDLAFLDDYWVPKDKKYVQSELDERKKIGLVLRDWDTDNTSKYLESMEKVLPYLDEKYKLTLFIFDKRTDKKVLAMVTAYDICLWDPMSIDFDDFSFQLASQDVLVTSRAHGSMCGAVLGVPSLIIELEPKLKTIHEILPSATSLITIEQINPKNLENKIEEVLKYDKQVISKDCGHNKKLIETQVFQSMKIN